MLATMHELDGSPSFQDPRAILPQSSIATQALGLTPVVATELEFYLLAGDWRERDLPRRRRR